MGIRNLVRNIIIFYVIPPDILSTDVAAGCPEVLLK
jgi:hypothetical protein